MDWRVDNYVLDFLTKETKLKGEVCLLNRKFYLLWWLFIKSKRFLYVSMMCFLIGVKNLVFLLAILSLYAETNLWKGCLVKAAVTSIFEASSTLFAFPEKKIDSWHKIWSMKMNQNTILDRFLNYPVSSAIIKELDYILSLSNQYSTNLLEIQVQLKNL